MDPRWDGEVNLTYDGSTGSWVKTQDLERPSQAELALQDESERSRLALLVVGARCVICHYGRMPTMRCGYPSTYITPDGRIYELGCFGGTITAVYGDAAAVGAVTFDIDIDSQHSDNGSGNPRPSMSSVPAANVRKIIEQDEDRFAVGKEVEATRDEGEAWTPWYPAIIASVRIPGRWELMIARTLTPAASDDSTVTPAASDDSTVPPQPPQGGPDSGEGGSDVLVHYRNTETGVIVNGKPADFAEHEGDETRYTINWDPYQLGHEWVCFEDQQDKSADEVREPVEVNDEGADIYPGAFIPGQYFCGREPEDESRTTDGGDRADGATQCGPMYGDQCASCQRYQTVHLAPHWIRTAIAGTLAKVLFLCLVVVSISALVLLKDSDYPQWTKYLGWGGLYIVLHIVVNYFAWKALWKDKFNDLTLAQQLWRTIVAMPLGPQAFRAERRAERLELYQQSQGAGN